MAKLISDTESTNGQHGESETEQLPRVAVVIVTYSTEAVIEKCLKSILPDRGGAEFEVIVVDNHSRDDTCQIIKKNFQSVHLIGNDSNLGFATAVNQGIKASTAPMVLLLNPDTEVMPGTIDEMIRKMQVHPDIGILGSTLLWPVGTPQVSACPFPNLYSTFTQQFGFSRLFPKSSILAPHRRFKIPPKKGTTIDVGFVSGACVMLRRQMLNKIGLLNETFFIYYEETELCYRAQKHHWRVALMGTEGVTHMGGCSGTSERAPKTVRASVLSLIHYYDCTSGIITGVLVRMIVSVSNLLRILRCFLLFCFNKFDVGWLNRSKVHISLILPIWQRRKAKIPSLDRMDSEMIAASR